jgi:hypothetical protein
MLFAHPLLFLDGVDTLTTYDATKASLAIICGHAAKTSLHKAGLDCAKTCKCTLGCAIFALKCACVTCTKLLRGMFCKVRVPCTCAPSNGRAEEASVTSC